MLIDTLPRYLLYLAFAYLSSDAPTRYTNIYGTIIYFSKKIANMDFKSFVLGFCKNIKLLNLIFSKNF